MPLCKAIAGARQSWKPHTGRIKGLKLEKVQIRRTNKMMVVLDSGYSNC